AAGSEARRRRHLEEADAASILPLLAAARRLRRLARAKSSAENVGKRAPARGAMHHRNRVGIQLAESGQPSFGGSYDVDELSAPDEIHRPPRIERQPTYELERTARSTKAEAPAAVENDDRERDDTEQRHESLDDVRSRRGHSAARVTSAAPAVVNLEVA